MPNVLSTASKTFSKDALVICEGFTFAVACHDDILVHSHYIITHAKHSKMIIE